MTATSGRGERAAPPLPGAASMIRPTRPVEIPAGPTPRKSAASMVDRSADGIVAAVLALLSAVLVGVVASCSLSGVSCGSRT